MESTFEAQDHGVNHALLSLIARKQIVSCLWARSLIILSHSLTMDVQEKLCQNNIKIPDILYGLLWGTSPQDNRQNQ